MKTMVNIKISWSDFLKVKYAMKKLESWLDYSENPYDKKTREAILMAMKAVKDSAEFINDKD